MKKILAMILALVMVCSLAACGGSGDEKTGDSKINATVFWYNEEDVYLSTVRAALNKEFKDAGIEFSDQFAGGQQPKQIEQIRTAVVGGSNLLIVNQVVSGDPDTAEQILEIAGDIPVIFFNRAIGTDDKPDLPVYENHSNVVFIGTDAPEAGHLQGKMIGEYVLEHYDDIDLNKDGKISYAMFKGEEANAEAIYRTQFGVEDADAVLTAAGKPALEYFDASNPNKYQVDLGGAWSAKAATEYMDTNFVTYNENSGNMIELVICNNDGMAEGVVASLQNKGYNKEGAHVVPVFGVDATANAKDLIANGAMTGTVKQDAEGMALAIRQTVEGIAAEKTPVEALAAVEGDIFSLAENCASKLYVAYQPYTGE